MIQVRLLRRISGESRRGLPTRHHHVGSDAAPLAMLVTLSVCCLLHPLPERLSAAVQSGSDGSDGHAEDPADLLIVKALDVKEQATRRYCSGSDDSAS